MFTHPDLYVSYKLTIYEDNKKATNPKIQPGGACVNGFFSNTKEDESRNITFDLVFKIQTQTK